jgi:arylsulfatase A-like enzyme
MNILLILVDDIGTEVYQPWGRGGAGAYPYANTPTLNALCAGGTVQGVVYPGGVRFTRAYVEQLCSPTRSALHTGRYPFRTGVGDIIRDDHDGVTSQAALGEDEYTLAKALTKQRGYKCAAFGKWHMGNTNVGGRRHPNRMGFETYSGNMFNLDPTSANMVGGTSFSEGYYSWDQTIGGTGPNICRTYHTSHVTNLAYRWIREQGDDDWFCYVALYGAHSPFDNRSDTTPARFNAPPTTLYDAATWTQAATIPAGPPNTAQTMHTFRAAIEANDTEIGRLIASLVKLDPDFWTNTCVVFLSDNGSPASTLVNETDPVLGGYPSGRGKDSPYETGIWTSLVVSGALVAAPIRTYNSIISVVDLFPTLLQGAGGAVPTVVGGPPSIPLVTDGVSFINVLTNAAPTTAVRGTVYSEFFQPIGAAPTLANPDAGRTANEWSIIGGDVAAGGTFGMGRYKLVKPGLNSPLEFYELTNSGGTYNGYFESTNLTPLGSTAGLNGTQAAAYTSLVAQRAALVRP